MESLRFADNSRYVEHYLPFSFSKAYTEFSVAPDARWVWPWLVGSVFDVFSFTLSDNTPFRNFALAIWTGCYLADESVEVFKDLTLLEDKRIDSVGTFSIYKSLFYS
jgi:hypothetical protein